MSALLLHFRSLRIGPMWLWESYYMRVARRAFWDSLFFVNLKVETGVYSVLTLGFGVLVYWYIAGQEAVEQRLTVVISGLIGVGFAFGLVFIFNLVMAPIRMDRELKAKAEKWHEKLKTQIREKELSASREPAARAGLEIEPLSEEATELLLEAVKDKGGHVIRSEYLSGSKIQTNGRTFGEQGNPKEQATWEAALDELFYAKLVQFQNGEVYRVTKAGFDLAEALSQDDDTDE